jgi:hypothetical protein
MTAYGRSDDNAVIGSRPTGVQRDEIVAAEALDGLGDRALGAYGIRSACRVSNTSPKHVVIALN